MNEQEIKKPLNLAIEEFKIDMRKLVGETKLPAYILEPIIKELYNECVMLAQQELEKARQEYATACEAHINKE
jgi:hypothetical protein